MRNVCGIIIYLIWRPPGFFGLLMYQFNCVNSSRSFFDRRGSHGARLAVLVMAAPQMEMREDAAHYYLLVDPRKDLSVEEVLAGPEGWVALHGSRDEALERYCWRVSDRTIFVASLRELRMLEFTLTHAGQSAVYLGFFKLEQKGWEQHAILRTWTSTRARYPGDLPMQLMCGNTFLWKFDPVPLPPPLRMLEFFDRLHALPWFAPA